MRLQFQWRYVDIVLSLTGPQVSAVQSCVSPAPKPALSELCGSSLMSASPSPPGFCDPSQTPTMGRTTWI
ncbi:hypothetical protein FKM82_028731 [Ascaphus truei]